MSRKTATPMVYARYAEVLPNGRGRIHDGKRWVDVPARLVVDVTRRAMAMERSMERWAPLDDDEPEDQP